MVLISNAIKRRSKTTKVYRGSEDGFSTSLFHKLCDGIAPSLTIIKSEDGRVFGGFTTVPWGLVTGGKNGQTQAAAYKKDSDAFIFSFTHQTIHRIIKEKEEQAINCVKDRLQCFGVWDLYISDNCNLNENSVADLGACYTLPVGMKHKSEAA